MEIRNDFLKKTRDLDNKFPVKHSGYLGTCGTSTATTLVLGLSVPPGSNYFLGMLVEVQFNGYPVDNTKQQIRKIDAYDPVTDKITVEAAWSANPTSEYSWRIMQINSGNYYTPAEVVEALKDADGNAYYSGVLYFDYVSGNDSTGDGSFGNPYKTISGKIGTVSDKLCFIKSNTMEADSASCITVNGDGVQRPYYIAGYNTRVRMRRAFYCVGDSVDGALFNLDFVPITQPSSAPFHAFYLGSFSCSFWFQRYSITAFSGSMFASFWNEHGPASNFAPNLNLAYMTLRNCHFESFPSIGAPSNLLTIMETSIIGSITMTANLALIRASISGDLTVDAVHALTDTVQVGGTVSGATALVQSIPNLVRQTLSLDNNFHNAAYWRISCRRERFTSVYDLPIILTSDAFSIRPSFTAVSRMEYIDGTDSIRALWKRNQKGVEITLTMPESTFNADGLEKALRPTYYLVSDELRDETLTITAQSGVNGGKGNLIQLAGAVPSADRLESVGSVDMGGGVTIWVYFKDIVSVGGVYYYKVMTLNADFQYLFSHCVYKGRSIHIHHRLFTLIDAPNVDRITFDLITVGLKMAAKYLNDPGENALLEG